MSLIRDIKTLKQDDIVLGIIVFAATLGPGMLVLQTFYAALVKDLNVLKLILLTLGITMPIVALNTLCSMVTTGELKKPGGPNVMGDALVGCAFSTVVLYVPLVITFFFHISLAMYALTAGCMQLTIVILTVVTRRTEV